MNIGEIMKKVKYNSVQQPTGKKAVSHPEQYKSVAQTKESLSRARSIHAKVKAQRCNYND